MNALQMETETANDTIPYLSIVPHGTSPDGALTVRVYRLHGFQVLDRDGRKIGIVDWIWTNQDSGHGEFLGVNLRWLRGTARAIPVLGAQIDQDAATIRVNYTVDEIKQARRFKIDRELTARDKRRIRFHYEVQPTVLHGLRAVESSAA